ncbi:ATP-grasp domain-containing protein [Actinophytocola glycyrrhizae]|uniref:ATP-grasp domain-containing protein n=1 Tax=Actinophytocola glycyrrhizae TaxID=2044873 RepID=A0ABV9S6G8_9PSEU
MSEETPDGDVRPLLILVSPMGRTTRGYLLSSVAQDHRIWLFSDTEPTWERPHIVGHTVVDTLDTDLMAQAAAHVPADAILCWDETRILPAARLAREVGLPGMDPEVVGVCRDKHLTRIACAAGEVPQAASCAVATQAEAAAVAARFGYPVVIKPRALVGSFGAALVRSPEELAAAFPHTHDMAMPEVRERFERPVLVEEFLDGPEISVDALCHGGEVTPLFLARKELGFPPYFEEVGHFVDAADPLLSDDRLRTCLTAAHRAVGLTAAWTHTEWRLTATGPRLVEINARSGGDLIPYLGLLATGVDAGLVAADLALGRAPDIRVRSSGVAAVRFLYPPQDMVVGDVRVDPARLPALVDRAEVLAQPGQHLRLPPRAHVSGRHAFVVATGATVEECRQVLDEAAAAVVLEPADEVIEGAVARR